MSMKDQDKNIALGTEAADKPQSIGRRSMLKGSVTALPAILTLQSGAALARSSNLISTTHYKTTDSDGHTLCLDLRSVEPVSRSRRENTFDMGSNPSGDVYRIPEREYVRKDRRGRWRPIDESALCERGGQAAYKVGDQMTEVNLPRGGGGMVSVTALASFSSKIVVYDI